MNSRITAVDNPGYASQNITTPAPNPNQSSGMTDRAAFNRAASNWVLSSDRVG